MSRTQRPLADLAEHLRQLERARLALQPGHLRVGSVVGEKLWSLGHQHQVMVVTHLPQLAAFGDHHWQVLKVIQDGRTVTQVTRLQGEARTLELAQMLGEVGEGTLRSAHDVLQTAQAFKTGK